MKQSTRSPGFRSALWPVVVVLLGLGSVSLVRARALPPPVITCTATGFVRDGINMTAARINPVGTVSGSIDATGCNIGIYYSSGNNGMVNNADIYGANYFGIAASTDGGGTINLTIKYTVVHHIGEYPHNGTQHGVGIYYRGFEGTIKGTIDDNWILDYQKGGLVLNGPGINVDVTDNTVMGDGHVSFIAQNGIQMAFGASNNTIARNFVSGNSYVGHPGDGSASAGILIAGGPGQGPCPPIDADCGYDTGLAIRNNVLIGNDVGVYLDNEDASNNPPTSPTNNTVSINTIYGDLCFNAAYQAGIAAVGNKDKFVSNLISGPGYSACTTGQLMDLGEDPSARVHGKPRHFPR